MLPLLCWTMVFSIQWHDHLIRPITRISSSRMDSGRNPSITLKRDLGCEPILLSPSGRHPKILFHHRRRLYRPYNGGISLLLKNGAETLDFCLRRKVENFCLRRKVENSLSITTMIGEVRSKVTIDTGAEEVVIHRPTGIRVSDQFFKMRLEYEFLEFDLHIKSKFSLKAKI